jgi:hypothetical protein
MRKPLAYCLVAAGLALLVLAKFDRNTGFTGLIRFGSTWAERRHESIRDLPVPTVAGSNGYDGQFYAQVALDPLLGSKGLPEALDAPAYRARRILLPGISFVIGVGHPWWILQTYALLNVFCWAVLGAVLYRCIPANDRYAFARWIGCMLSMGALESVRQSLVDLPAALLLVLAVDFSAKNRPTGSVVWAALANLTKETSLLASVALYCPLDRHPKSWMRAGAFLLATAVPIALWALYVHQHLGTATRETGLGNFTWPLAGLVAQAQDSIREIASGNFDSRFTFGVLGMIGLLTQAWFFWRHRRPQLSWWRIGFVYSLLLVFLSAWVWSGYWAACRAVLPMTIAFNLLLPASRRAFWPWWIAGNFTMIHAVWRFL